MLTKRILIKFCKLTPETYKKISQQFLTNPKMSILEPYFKPYNLVYIYNLIRGVPIKHTDKLTYLTQIQERLCTNSTDVQFNIMANLHNDKCKIYMEMDNMAEAAVEIERALQSIRAMQRPYNIQVAYLLLNAADVHMNSKNLLKAQKCLKQTDHILSLTQQEMAQISQQHTQLKNQMQKQINQMKVRLSFEYCKLCSMNGKIFEARQYLAQFFENWESIQAYHRDQLLYLLAIRYKCIIHSELKEEKSSIETADQYLQNHKSTPRTQGFRMWFMKFLLTKGIKKYQSQLTKNIQDLSKVMSEQQLTNFLRRHGVISRNRTKIENTQKKAGNVKNQGNTKKLNNKNK